MEPYSKNNCLNQSSIDAFYTRNTLGVTGAELAWGLALPVIIESTFIQIFLASIGANNQQVGLVPSIYSVCVALFAPFSSLLTSHLHRKKSAIVITHVLCSLPVIFFGLALAKLEHGSVLALFFSMYFFFSAMIGITIPLWQNFLVKIFSAKKSIKAISTMYIFQTAARITGGLLISGMITKYALNTRSASVVFIISGTLFLAGSFSFLLVHEGEQEEKKQKRHSLKSFIKAMRSILRHKNFVVFILSGLENTALVTVISFFAKYAVELKGINVSYGAGLFASSIYTGAIVSNIVFGWYGLFRIKTKYMISKVVGIVSVALVMTASSPVAFFFAGFLIGISRGINMLAFSPAVRNLSGKEDSTDYFSAVPIILLPFSFGIPWLAGAGIDAMGNTQFAFTAMFSVMAGLILVSIFLINKVSFKEQ